MTVGPSSPSRPGAAAVQSLRPGNADFPVPSFVLNGPPTPIVFYFKSLAISCSDKTGHRSCNGGFPNEMVISSGDLVRLRFASRDLSMSDPVYAVDLIHDRPIEGFASFEDGPHHFKCEFDEDADEYSDVYCLSPISVATLQLVLDRWQIWLRWNAAFRANETSLDTHPALPNERARYNELNEAIDQALKGSETTASWARAKFLPDETAEWTRVTSRRVTDARRECR